MYAIARNINGTGTLQTARYATQAMAQADASILNAMGLTGWFYVVAL